MDRLHWGAVVALTASSIISCVASSLPWVFERGCDETIAHMLYPAAFVHVLVVALASMDFALHDRPACRNWTTCLLAVAWVLMVSYDAVIGTGAAIVLEPEAECTTHFVSALVMAALAVVQTLVVIIACMAVKDPPQRQPQRPQARVQPRTQHKPPPFLTAIVEHV